MENYDLSKTQIEWLIEEFIFDKVHREICRFRFIDGMTYDELSYAVGMSARHVRRITFDCKQKLIKHIKEVPLREVV